MRESLTHEFSFVHTYKRSYIKTKPKPSQKQAENQAKTKPKARQKASQHQAKTKPKSHGSRKLPELLPKLIKRIDLGPLHNVFAKDENEITHAILDGIAKKEIPLESYALSISIDEVYSNSEFSEGGFFNKQTLQKWSDVNKQNYVFAPHRIIQSLYSKTPELMDSLAKPPFQVADLKIDKID